jgi:hypothetical protein
MKRNVLFAVAFFATLSANAQSIAAVSPSNVTTMYQTLDKAVTEADPGSVIYLPGGGFNISDDTKITKKITIMGVSHRADADNADGATNIAGNLNFVGGSSGSAVTGVFLSGNINIGDEEAALSNFTIRFCNVSSVQVNSNNVSGVIVNQCYLRNPSKFGYSNASIENNVVHSVGLIKGGTINHNIIVSNAVYYGIGSTDRYGTYYQGYALASVNGSTITNNILLDSNYCHNGGDCIISNNSRGTSDWEADKELIKLEDETSWDDVFEPNNSVDKAKGVTVNSNYKLKGKWGKGAASDGTDLGIYGGSGFKDDKSLAPIPRIVSKKVNEHTDGSGNLHIEITVKAE